MADRDYTRRVRRWWAEQWDRGTLINVIEIRHPKWKGNQLLISDYGEVFRFTDENMRNRVAAPVYFEFTEPDNSISTDQEFQIQIDGMGGKLHDEIRALDDSDRQKEMRLIYRQYLSDAPGAPVVDPPLRLTITEITSEQGVISARCTAKNTHNSRCGQYYEIDAFPELRYL